MWRQELKKSNGKLVRFSSVPRGMATWRVEETRKKIPSREKWLDLSLPFFGIPAIWYLFWDGKSLARFPSLKWVIAPQISYLLGNVRFTNDGPFNMHASLRFTSRHPWRSLKLTKASDLVVRCCKNCPRLSRDGETHVVGKLIILCDQQLMFPFRGRPPAKKSCHPSVQRS